MATKSQPAGSNATSSQPKPARSRKIANETEGTASRRAGSGGGVVLPKDPPENKSKPSTATKTATPPAPANDAPSTGPNRQRRRPRKLNREPVSTQTLDVKAPDENKAGRETVPPASTTELEALKSRVRGLEAKVEELYNSSAADTRPSRSPRRRGKGRKSSSQQVPTISTTAETVKVEDEEEADEELGRLEDELEDARRDLEVYDPKSRPRNKRTTSEETEYIEEIPRDGVGVEDTVSTGNRQVTLSGSYRIPLPSTVSMSDVKTIQSGVTAAQNVAKGFLDQRRARQAMEDPKPSTSTASKPSVSRAKQASTTDVGQDGERKTWGEFFGGYSMAISRAVKTIEAEAAVEGQKAGTAGAKAPAPAKKAPAAKASSKPTPKAKRPAMKGGLSSEQAQGLMK
ncbi:hypothetical protein BDV95DRAFT_354448 [Massariosphaeria phaeospora]|uniref:Uncharacterized protein n=1 Tax=Massariosphaeria phaeospora TaxID=100035 RepID=A0A7C8MAT6_9PLEO|nr:hypothetical protein BDV95DRAFT_354448 [Massariosphaeria phaeospora]